MGKSGSSQRLQDKSGAKLSLRQEARLLQEAGMRPGPAGDPQRAPQERELRPTGGQREDSELVRDPRLRCHPPWARPQPRPHSPVKLISLSQAQPLSPEHILRPGLLDPASLLYLGVHVLNPDHQPRALPLRWCKRTWPTGLFWKLSVSMCVKNLHYLAPGRFSLSVIIAMI